MYARILTSFLFQIIDPNESIQDHEYRIHEINTLEWDELVVPEDPNKSITTEAGNGFCIASSSIKLILHYNYLKLIFLYGRNNLRLWATKPVWK